MKRDVNSIDKNGFSTKFFEELAKEYDKSKDLADRQKTLKRKHHQSAPR